MTSTKLGQKFYTHHRLCCIKVLIILRVILLFFLSTHLKKKYISNQLLKANKSNQVGSIGSDDLFRWSLSTQDRCQGAFIWVSGRRPPVNLGALSMTSLVDGLYLAMIEHYLQLVSSAIEGHCLRDKTYIKMNLCDPCRLHQQANPKKKNLHTIKSTTSESPVSGDTESEANLNCTIALMGCGYRLIVSR